MYVSILFGANLVNALFLRLAIDLKVNLDVSFFFDPCILSRTMKLNLVAVVFLLPYMKTRKLSK